ncbi:hypothetical protein [Acidobacterium capsulatum]|uniref:Uncharacterized protein n=1 Tax=Acidobacterium capsulatum (strain ATCC 51196 / DSM 11244 / BCRC 80197 / JCM 7670 / NBRC 15755 / NCIMB 13165 / 161) TaxID=240015 RepID=C1F4N5_ACIC5|nr:hypothetical protein [Acidobacterium capsulatum]ACO32107.1 hypothetical protein ACP_1169 [Acidobacterium capsulatum ATCC 51196]ACO33590.1 hypothetical protein ACP_1152 [Acidobacterium capsulatum ATCC 51196]
MKKSSYLLGLASGVVAAAYWRTILKEGIKGGVRAGRVVQRVSAQAIEEMQDASAEAWSEIEQQDHKASK